MKSLFSLGLFTYSPFGLVTNKCLFGDLYMHVCGDFGAANGTFIVLHVIWKQLSLVSDFGTPPAYTEVSTRQHYCILEWIVANDTFLPISEWIRWFICYHWSSLVNLLFAAVPYISFSAYMFPLYMLIYLITLTPPVYYVPSCTKQQKVTSTFLVCFLITIIKG